MRRTGTDTSKSGASQRAEALRAEIGKAYVRYPVEVLEHRIDRPPENRNGWQTWNRNAEDRVEAIFLRQSWCWPICMRYAVLTVGVLGLSAAEARKKRYRLGPDEGPDTFVLNKHGNPTPLQQSHIVALLGMKKQNINATIQGLIRKKRLTLDEGKYYPVAKPTLSEQERKVMSTHYFLGLDVISTDDKLLGFVISTDDKKSYKPPPELLERLRHIPDPVVRKDYIQRFNVIRKATLDELRVIRTREKSAIADLCTDVDRLISQGDQRESEQEREVICTDDFLGGKVICTDDFLSGKVICTDDDNLINQSYQRFQTSSSSLEDEDERAGGPTCRTTTTVEGQSVSQSTDRPTDTLPPEFEAIRQAIPEDLIEDLGETPSRPLLKRTHVKLRGAPVEWLTQRIRLRRRIVTSLGVIEQFAEDVGKAYQDIQRRRQRARAAPLPPAPSSAEDIAALIAEARDILSDPQAGTGLHQWARDMLAAHTDKTKTAGGGSS